VLHDTLPRGTGYLQRLADHAEFREVLQHSRNIVANCPCQYEAKRACHRCLLGHISDAKFALVSRAEALAMLDELLGDWATASVPATDRISLWDQVESELEARFVKALEDWAAESAPSVLFRRGAVLNGKRIAELHISREDGQLVHWQVTLQNTIDGTQPDVEFKRVDAAPMTVAVYLDGYAYHAAADRNRLAGDANQRARLRAEGTVVFQLNWDDVNAAAEDAGGGHQPWHPYQGNAQAAARATYVRLGDDPAELPELIWTTGLRTLFAFLRDPDRAAWSHRAEAAVAGLLRVQGAERVSGDQDSVPERTRLALSGQPLPPGGDGPIALVRAVDASGCPVAVLIDTRRADAQAAPLGVWSALTVIDDRRATILAGKEAHERRWAAWLYWGNLIQFLPDSGGDGAQLAWTALDVFDPSVLAAAGGAGLAMSVMQADQEISEAELSLLGAVHSVPSPGVTVDTQWAEVYDVLTPEVEVLTHALADLGVPAPGPDQVGHELGTQAWQAELAWPGLRLAVIAPGPEADDCIAAYAAADWDARLPGDWSPDELGLRILGGDR
jgi:hypothetical protein